MADLPLLSHSVGLRTLEQLIADWPDAVFMYDGDAERYVFANKAAQRLVGYSWDELQHLKPTDISHPDDARQLPDLMARAALDGWVRRPWRRLRKDGTVVQTELTLLRRRIDGRDLMQSICRVVGDRVQDLPKHGAAVDERLEILDRTSLAVVTLNREGVVTSWNAGATEHFQLTADETVGRQVRELVRSDADLADVEALMRPHEKQDEWISKLTIRRPSDEYEAMVTCSAIRSEDGELSGFLLITAPLAATRTESTPRMRRARVQCAACGREVAGTMRRKYCSEKCRQWAYYHRHLDAQRERSRQRHERRRGEGEDEPAQDGGAA